jgi:hypothetical protein
VVLALVLVPAVSIVIFSNQLYRVSWYGLSPWKGGGFGMFSSVDRPENRFLKIYLRVDGEYVPAQAMQGWGDTLLESKFGRDALALSTEPTQGKLERLVRQISAEPWILTTDRRITWLPTGSDGRASADPGIGAGPGAFADLSKAERVEFDALRVEVWRATYEKRAGRIRAEKLLEATHAVR